jgi:predicted enzyme related to lactoylglutathione lyase
MRILQQGFRVYTEANRFEESIRFYEELQGVECERRVKIAETGVEAAKVGGFLTLAGDNKHIDTIRYVNAIFYVDSLEEFSNWLSSKGVETIHKPRVVTSGRNLTARHADGLVVEYFESANPEGN